MDNSLPERSRAYPNRMTPEEGAIFKRSNPVSHISVSVCKPLNDWQDETELNATAEGSLAEKASVSSLTAQHRIRMVK